MSEREIVLSLVLLSTVAVSIPAVMVLGEGITKDETTPPPGGGESRLRIPSKQ